MSILRATTIPTCISNCTDTAMAVVHHHLHKMSVQPQKDPRTDGQFEAPRFPILCYETKSDRLLLTEFFNLKIVLRFGVCHYFIAIIYLVKICMLYKTRVNSKGWTEKPVTVFRSLVWMDGWMDGWPSVPTEHRPRGLLGQGACELLSDLIINISCFKVTELS